MNTVADILDAKGRDVWTISPSATVLEALRLMADKNVGALVVLDGRKVQGIVSERDYARKGVLQGKASKDTAVSQISTGRVLCVPPKRTVQECMALMTDKHIRHLPVVDGDELLGVVSIGDIVKALISQQKFIIDQLEQYITGR